MNCYIDEYWFSIQLLFERVPSTPVEILETNLEANEGVIHIVNGLLTPLESVGSCSAVFVIPDDGEACCEGAPADETCAREKREETCEKEGDEALTKDECLALKCYQFNAF